MKLHAKDYAHIIRINNKRKKQVFGYYDPMLGINSLIPRFYLQINTELGVYLPKEMKDLDLIYKLRKYTTVSDAALMLTGKYDPSDIVETIMNLRSKYDFEFWAATAAYIEDKETRSPTKFILNYPQRKLVRELEKQRLRGKPIRINLLKARQWGGSTCIQMYMAWLQIFWKKNWHSAIIADVEEQARNIRAMYSRLAREHPHNIQKMTLVPYEKSVKNIIMQERGNIIGIGSAQKPDNLRSFSFSMAHLSEVGFWKTTEGRTGKDLAQSIKAAIPDIPYTLICQESTAKGVGNYWHQEYRQSEKNQTGYIPFFIPFFDISYYSRPIENYKKFIKSMDSIDWHYWQLGASLEAIKWRKEYKEENNFDDWRMKSEYPGSSLEAFQTSGNRFFAPKYVHSAREKNREPQYVGRLVGKAARGKKGLRDVQFEPSEHGELYMWETPNYNYKNRYVIFVDIGGTTPDADWSAMRVFDRLPLLSGEPLRAVATYRSHKDQDIVAWDAARLGVFYDNALVAVEVNSLKRKEADEAYLTVLDEIKDYYSNLYARNVLDAVKEGAPLKYGFHTNRSTKFMILSVLRALIRTDDEEKYIEPDSRVCDEMDYYEEKENGTLGAVEGEHDDLVMTTAGGIWLALRYSYLDLPRAKKAFEKKKTPPPIESTF